MTFDSATSTSDIVTTGNSLTFTKTGTYLIEYDVTATLAGTGAAVSTIYLRKNGVIIDGTTSTLTTGDTVYTGQAIVTVSASQTVDLYVDAGTGYTVTVNAASLTAVRIA